MNRKRLSVLMVVASMLFGMTVAVLAVTGSDAVGLVAMIGGGILGIGWAAISMVTTKERA